MPAERVAGYQPFWAARLDLCLKAGDAAGAEAARAQAIALTDDTAVQTWLRAR
jgi:RNA polymerase sigma-70 factor (ECF subfamily)